MQSSEPHTFTRELGCCFSAVTRYRYSAKHLRCISQPGSYLAPPLHKVCCDPAGLWGVISFDHGMLLLFTCRLVSWCNSTFFNHFTVLVTQPEPLLPTGDSGFNNFVQPGFGELFSHMINKKIKIKKINHRPRCRFLPSTPLIPLAKNQTRGRPACCSWLKRRAEHPAMEHSCLPHDKHPGTSDALHSWAH